jgi:hypothetical protein
MLPVLLAARDARTAAADTAAVFKIPREIEGMEDIGEDQRASLTAALDRTDALVAESRHDNVPTTNTFVDGAAVVETMKTSKKEGLGDTSDQPQAGTKSNAKGPVTWKFGAYLCHGTLLPSRETKTHCYARTHKGNIKTLKKGGAYWRLG